MADKRSQDIYSRRGRMRPNIGEIQLRYMRENDWKRLDRPLLGVVPDWRESFGMLIKCLHVGSKSVFSARINAS